MDIEEFLKLNEGITEQLLAKIKSNNKNLEHHVEIIRNYWEFTNTMYNLYKEFSFHNISLVDKEALDIITNEYSRMYYPELKHSTVNEYNKLYSEMYSNIRNIILGINKANIRVLDYGCGILQIPLELIKHKKITYYLGYDNNYDIIKINKYILKKLGLENKKMEFVFCYTDKGIFEKSVFDAVLFSNLFKYFSDEKIYETINKVHLYNQPCISIIYDHYEVIDRIKMIFSNSPLFCEKKNNNILIISKKVVD